MRSARFLWIVLVIMILMDVYIFQAIKTVIPRSRVVSIVYWTLSALVWILLLLLPYINDANLPRSVRSYSFAIVVGLLVSKLLAVVFFAMDDLRRGVMWVIGKLFSNPSVAVSQSAEGITRSTFLSWLGLAAGGGLFSTLVYGFSNKYAYHVKRVKLAFDNLPPAFRGLKIVQISDIHSGSFNNEKAVARGVDMILDEKADLILFTGDLVNDRAVEMKDYEAIFSRVKAPMGVYSTLGNHDYGDYVHWETEAAKAANLEDVKAIHGRMGWRLLMNEHVILEKGGQQIALLGIENWGAKGNFPKYGKMDQAYPGTEPYAFKILMSHDPSHWDAEVRPKYPDIDLMLSGHTHGMQFGVELPGFKWSPVQYMYKQWAGLYQEGRQQLYVNRGYGFIGYPGRVGILPEITVIELV